MTPEYNYSSPWFAIVLVLAITSSSGFIVCQPLAAETLLTDHFQIQVGTMPLPGIEAILEQLYANLVDFFEVEPRRRLQVVIFDSRMEFEQKIEPDPRLGDPRTMGGLYDPGRQTAYTWRRSSDGRTRDSLIHEVAHAFHDAISNAGRFPAEWYTEGIADYFAQHCWNGMNLTTGVRPVISSDDLGKAALDSLTARSWDLRPLLFRTFGYERGESWALVHFLATHFPKELGELGATAEDPEAAWNKVFGGIPEDFVDEFRRHLLEIQQPWSVISGHWSACGDTISGYSEGLGLAVLKQRPPAVNIEVLETPRGGQPGFVPVFHSLNDYLRLMRSKTRPLFLERVEFGQVSEVRMIGRPRHMSTSASVFSAVQHNAKLRIFIDAVRVATLPAQGQIGIVVRAGASSFRICENDSLHPCTSR